MKKILLLETLAGPAYALLEKANDVETATAYDFDYDPVDRVHTEALITRGKGLVSKEVMDRFPNLKIIARVGVGVNNIDVEQATKRGIKVLNNPGVNAQTVAEHTLGLMLMLQRNMYRAAQEVKNGHWLYRNQYGGDELYDKTLGIVGFGNIGEKVATLAKAFGMHVIYTSQQETGKKVAYRTWDELIAEADIISLHVPLTLETEKIINVESLEKMKKTALLINTARGALVDEPALLAALKNKEIGGYAADVMGQQPPREENELMALPNVLITPHLASLTARTYNKMCMDAVNNVLALLRNEQAMEACVYNPKNHQGFK